MRLITAISKRKWLASWSHIRWGTVASYVWLFFSWGVVIAAIIWGLRTWNSAKSICPVEYPYCEFTERDFDSRSY